jgi:glucosamine kinase
MTTLVAVDAGQGGTRAMLLRPDGTVLAHGEAEGVRHLGLADGPSATASAVSSAIRAALGDHPAPMTAVIAISGWTQDAGRREELMARVAAAVPLTRQWLTSDAVAAFFAAPTAERQVSLAVGTGSVAIAADGSGSWAIVDGVGYLLGDAGSGFWVGQRGLANALAAADGRGGSDKLRERAAARFGATELLNQVYGHPHPASFVASFALDVVAAAGEGDADASAIIVEAGTLLARTADAAATRVFGDSEVTVALSGRMVTGPGPLIEALATALADRRPNARVLQHDRQPLEGAAFLARDPGRLRQWFPALFSQARI